MLSSSCLAWRLVIHLQRPLSTQFCKAASIKLGGIRGAPPGLRRRIDQATPVDEGGHDASIYPVGASTTVWIQGIISQERACPFRTRPLECAFSPLTASWLDEQLADAPAKAVEGSKAVRKTEALSRRAVTIYPLDDFGAFGSGSRCCAGPWSGCSSPRTR